MELKQQLDRIISCVRADQKLIMGATDAQITDCISRLVVTGDKAMLALFEREATDRGLLQEWDLSDLFYMHEHAELAQALQAELGMGKPLSREERVAELDRWIEANRLANGMHDWHVVEWCHHIATQCRARFGAFL